MSEEDDESFYARMCEALPELNAAATNDEHDDDALDGASSYTYRPFSGGLPLGPVIPQQGQNVLLPMPATAPPMQLASSGVTVPVKGDDEVSYNPFMQTGDRRVPCPRCGFRTTNLGGTTRGIKYAHQCENKSCEFVFNQNRLPDALGRYEVSVSNKATSAEKPNRCDYKCGRCGQLKRGHVCPFAEDETGAVSAVKPVNPALIGQPMPVLPPLAASTLAPPLVMPSLEPTPSIEPTPSVDDGTKEDEDDESEHEDAWPVGKTRVRVDGRIEICKMRQIVRHGVPCKGMEFYWESMPSLKPTMQATPSAKVDASLFAPLPPMASSLLGLSDDQTTGSSMTIETAVANVVANAAKVAADVVSSVSSVTTTPDSSKKLPMQTDDNLPTVSTDDTAPHITGIDVIRQLQLSRYRVCGDGSCTNYAVLATAGLCEHANTRLSKPPTPLDRGRDAVLRVRAYDLLERDKKALNLSQEDTDWLPSLLTMPKYPLTTVEDMGTFGTMLSIRGIAQYIGVTIVVWNKKTLRNISARQQVAVYSAATDSTEERMWSCSDIVQAHATSPLMHIEWDGVNHYSALVGLTPVRISPAALAELTTAPRVTEKDEDEGDALPDGWSVFSNQYREPSKMSGPKTIRGVQEQCADALRKGFNAFIVLSDRVFYLQYSANLTTKDVMPVADMQVQLYAFSDKKKKKLKMERLTDFSCCGQLYLEKSTDLACLKCDRSFHVSCILKSIGISESKKNEWLTRHADSWLCRDCCKKLRQ